MKAGLFVGEQSADADRRSGDQQDQGAQMGHVAGRRTGRTVATLDETDAVKSYPAHALGDKSVQIGFGFEL